MTMVHTYAGLLVEMTAELVRRSSKDGAVIVTWASSAYLDFLRNWVHYIASWDIDNILIGKSSEVLHTIAHLVVRLTLPGSAF